MDGEADFVFDLPVYHLMKRRAPGMSFYHGYTEHEFISVQVHVTETLTGKFHLPARGTEDICPLVAGGRLTHHP